MYMDDAKFLRSARILKWVQDPWGNKLLDSSESPPVNAGMKNSQRWNNNNDNNNNWDFDKRII